MMVSSIVSSIGRLVEAEPVQAQAIVQAVFGVALAFGIGLSQAQAGALLGLIAAILAFITRQAVTPVARPRDDAGRALTPDAGLPAPAVSVGAAQRPIAVPA